MTQHRVCEACLTSETIITAAADIIRYACFADIGPTWFSDYQESCLARIMLDGIGQGPKNYLQLRARFHLLVALSVTDTPNLVAPPDSASREGPRSVIWSE